MWICQNTDLCWQPVKGFVNTMRREDEPRNLQFYKLPLSVFSMVVSSGSPGQQQVEAPAASLNSWWSLQNLQICDDTKV